MIYRSLQLVPPLPKVSFPLAAICCFNAFLRSETHKRIHLYEKKLRDFTIAKALNDRLGVENTGRRLLGVSPTFRNQVNAAQTHIIDPTYGLTAFSREKN